MSAPERDWPEMTWPLKLICVTEEWRYDSACGAGYGLGRLTLWEAPDGHVAMVSDIGVGASPTNSAEDIWAALRRDFGEPLVLLEHYPGSGLYEEHIDQVDLVDGQPRWRRIWPTPSDHPLHEELNRWGAALLALSAEPSAAPGTLLGGPDAADPPAAGGAW